MERPYMHQHIKKFSQLFFWFHIFHRSLRVLALPEKLEKPKIWSIKVGKTWKRQGILWLIFESPGKVREKVGLCKFTIYVWWVKPCCFSHSSGRKIKIFYARPQPWWGLPSQNKCSVFQSSEYDFSDLTPNLLLIFTSS